MRTADKADPDPELMTVALRVWPLMLIVTINNLVFLTYIAGISGGYVFIVIFVNFLTTYVVLWKTLKVPQKKDSGDRKDQVPEEEIPRLEIKNEKDAPSEDKEEPENAPIEMSVLAAGTSKDTESQEEEQQAEVKTEDKKETPGLAAGTSEDAEELQSESKTEDNEEADDVEKPPPPPSAEFPDIEGQEQEKTEDNVEADGAQIPPSTELPGADPSKDIESQEEEKQTETKTEARLEKAKEEEENFLFAASICSTWIPSVVGDPEQRFFLKAGEVFGLSLLCVQIHFTMQNHPGVVSLVTKSFFLVVVIILANFGFQKDRPFLLHCVDENSTSLNRMDDVILCPNLTSCFSERKFSEPSKENFTELSAVLQHLELANSSLEQFEKKGNLTKRALKKIELMREKVKEAQLLAEEVEEEMLNPKRLRQQIRICGDEESTLRVVTLSSVVSLLVLAALATYQLHKITDYKVGFV